MSAYLEALKTQRPFVFTAGDLIEGLSFLEPTWRRAVLFGLEQGLDAESVVTMTHKRARQMRLTELARAVVEQSPRHIRLEYLFWQQLQDGLVTPLIGFADQVRVAFAGMEWATLLGLYPKMVWLDLEFEAEHFAMTARELGLIKP